MPPDDGPRLDRRGFLVTGGLSLALAAARGVGVRPSTARSGPADAGRRPRDAGTGAGSGASPAADLTLFLCGDVMTGRGIDQILPHSVPPTLHERYVSDARTYVALAEEESGPIPDDVPYAYPWGDALEELERVAPDHRIVNLETAVTADGEPWPGKGIHYRMHPENVPLLTAAGLDACVLANNHILDWGYGGLETTLEALAGAGLQAPGAGDDLAAARAPAVLDAPRAPDEPPSPRVLLFALGAPSAGVPAAWAATENRPGVSYLPDVAREAGRRVARLIEDARRGGEVGAGGARVADGTGGEAADLVVVSLHWGGNWGYPIPEGQRAFARALIEEAGVDLVHGHSSHHPKGLEVHEGRLILYGCGDFLNDYEGISGHERFRPELTLMYFPTLDPSGRLVRLVMTPLRIRRFRLERASREAAEWLADTLDRESRPMGTRVRLREDGRLAVDPGKDGAAG